MTRRPLALLLLAVLGVPATLEAQSATQLVNRGVAAYENLDFATAAQRLRQALAATGRAALTEPDRARALTYLGAAELFRDNRSVAVAAFRELVIIAPRARPDARRFPATVRRVYDEVRETTKATTVEVPGQAGIVAGSESYPIRVYASSTHQIRVVVEDREGRVLDTLVTGRIRDSLTILWDAMDGAGRPVDPGAYTMVVSTSVSPAAVLRSVRIPLAIRRGPADTLPHPVEPADTAFLVERTSGTSPARILVPAILAGVAAVALPSIIGADDPSAARFAAGAGIVLGGGATYWWGGRGKPIPGNAARNDTLRMRWERQLGEVVRENRRRRDIPRLIIESGPIERREGGS